MKFKRTIWIVIIVVVVGAIIYLADVFTAPAKSNGQVQDVRTKADPIEEVTADEPIAQSDDGSLDEPETRDENLSEEDRREEEANRLVDEFDELTDKWMEPREDGVSMDDADRYLAKFKSLPLIRREECLQRALNLVPDENVMLLAAILMDKSLGKDLVELVFNDVLNRDEDVKKPILESVYRDKSHPCWADTAWIFDVTGEKVSE